MKTMKPKTVFLFLVLMGCLPATGYADTLQGAIDEALIVPLATLEAHIEASQVLLAPFGYIWHDKIRGGSEYQTYLAKAKARAKTKARQGKRRARHCRAILKPVDNHLEIVEIINCVQTMEAIADMCSTATERFRVNKQLKVNVVAELDTLKGYATQCVTKNLTGFSALMVYLVSREAKDRYAGVIEKCRQEETNTLGVLGYEFIWPCFKGYLDMIEEPLEPTPTEISPVPAEDSEAPPKVKA